MARKLFRSNAEIARDNAQPDMGKLVLGLGLVGVAGWLGYEYFWKPKMAAAAQPSGPVQPGPGPGNLPGPVAPPPGGVVGDSAQQGDTILVTTAKLSGAPAGLPPTVEMVVTAAVAGSPVILAQATGRSGDNLPAGFGLPVPRSEITMVTRSTPGGGGTPPMPGNLPGPIPGLPNVIPPVILPTDLGNPMNLQNGHHYRARVQLDGLEAMVGTPALVASTLQAQGFTDIQVFKAGDPLPADWPQSTVIAPTPGTFYVQGTWGGPNGPVARPPQIAMAWEQ